MVCKLSNFSTPARTVLQVARAASQLAVNPQSSGIDDTESGGQQSACRGVGFGDREDGRAADGVVDGALSPDVAFPYAVLVLIMRGKERVTPPSATLPVMEPDNCSSVRVYVAETCMNR